MRTSSAVLRSLAYLAVFLLGMGTMRLYDTSTETVQPPLERVTIMRPVSQDAIPKPVEKLPEILPTKSAPVATDTAVSTSTTTPATHAQALDSSAESPPPESTSKTSLSSEAGIVEFVYDGDTVRLADKRKIRLIGIDTPEMNYGKGEPECYAREAKKHLESLVIKKEVTLVADKEDKDRYGRLLRYVYVTSPSGSVFVNNALMLEGAGLAKRYPPNTTQAEALEGSMQKAQAAKLGLWGVCKK
jgi:endonuclease YncB( thermonuclease family)